MKITEVIWLTQFVEKIERKHGVSTDEVEEVFVNRPHTRLIERGDVGGENLYRAIGQTDDGRYLTMFYIHKGRNRALVISARDANQKSEEAMANTKSKAKTTKRRDPLPEHFSSLEEAAEFWDTHDSTDYEEYMTDVKCDYDIKKRTYLVSLDGNLYRKVQAIARKKGVPAEKLVNLWIEEKAS